MTTGSIDAVVTSPPYNIGVAYRSYDDRKPRDIYLAWMEEIAKQIARVLAEDGALFLNLSSTGTDPWIAADVADRFRQRLTLQNRIIWVKSISINGETRGHFKPINSARFLSRTNDVAPERHACAPATRHRRGT
ncbi:site-specific DNA-methyltransferase [Frigidibacter mobilis]|nr:site-specific DNA-methyltransferase [Frigidibacter mobilis]